MREFSAMIDDALSFAEVENFVKIRLFFSIEFVEFQSPLKLVMVELIKLEFWMFPSGDTESAGYSSGDLPVIS